MFVIAEYGMETVLVTPLRRTLVSSPSSEALVTFSVLTLLLGRQEGHPACKKMGDGGGRHWLVWLEWHPAEWSVCLPLLIFPYTVKQKFSSGTDSPGGLGKGP